MASTSDNHQKQAEHREALRSTVTATSDHMPETHVEHPATAPSGTASRAESPQPPGQADTSVASHTASASGEMDFDSSNTVERKSTLEDGSYFVSIDATCALSIVLLVTGRIALFTISLLPFADVPHVLS